MRQSQYDRHKVRMIDVFGPLRSFLFNSVNVYLPYVVNICSICSFSRDRIKHGAFRNLGT